MLLFAAPALEDGYINIIFFFKVRYCYALYKLKTKKTTNNSFYIKSYTYVITFSFN